jgi:alpha-glucoside transport system permease protein
VVPALVILAFFLVYPAVHTIILSLGDKTGEGFAGFSNYRFVFTNRTMQSALRNNLLWVVVFTAGTVGLGLTMAVLLDRVKYERIAKAIIFLPMAVSFVGSGVIWKFVYSFRPASVAQTGLLNGIVVALGGQPIGWLIERPWINNFALIFVGVWIWTGFCMVVLSATYKGIPKSLLESARLDGATEWQVFWRITFPLMRSTIAVAATMMLITVLKIFDIVYVMTNGNFGTEVIANRMYKEMFQFKNFGRASAIAVVLLLAIIPVMIFNLKRFREQEAIR